MTTTTTTPIEQRQALAQHFSPERVACMLAAKAVEVMPDAKLFLEPTAGDGAVFCHLPVERRLGVEIDSALAQRHGFVCADILHFRSDQLPTGVCAQEVCVVGNPPFTDRALYRGNRRASGRVWLADFLAHLTTLCARAVLLLPSTVFGREWFERSPHMRLDEYADLGRVCFGATKGATVHVHICVLSTRIEASVGFGGGGGGGSGGGGGREKEGMDQHILERALSAHVQVLEAGDERANCAVMRWASPGVIGQVITSPQRLAAMRAKLSERQRKRRASATALFLLVRRESNRYQSTLWRLQDMRQVWRARFAHTRNTSVSFSLADFIKAF